LTRPLRLDVHLELDLAQAQDGPERALSICEAAAERAAATGDAAGEALARAMVASHALDLVRSTPDELEALVRAALPQLEEAGDDRGLARAWFALGSGVYNTRGQWGQMTQAIEQAIKHSRAFVVPGDEYVFDFVLGLVIGPSPADQALERIDALEMEFPPGVLLERALLLAMLDRFDEAWSLGHEQSKKDRELAGIDAGFGDWFLADIAELAGDYAHASQRRRHLCSTLEKHNYLAMLADTAPRLGRVLCRLGEHAEADELADKGHELADPQDASSQMLWRQVKALVLSHHGKHGEAERLAREAVAIADTTEGLNAQGDTRYDLAEVLTSAGRNQEAAAVLAEALDRYEAKKNLALARRARERLGELEPMQ
jgi:hypothetical protein